MIYFARNEVNMFDNLRDSAESSSFYEEEQNDLYKGTSANLLKKTPRLSRFSV
jgi:hypothetical protein